MTNYNVTGDPLTGSRGVSSVIRGEFSSISTAINSKSDKLSRSSVSSTSLLISVATKTLVVETGKDFGPGENVIIASRIAPSVNNMIGMLTSYDTATGLAQVAVSSVTGSGTLSDWVFAVSTSSGTTLVNNTFTGYQNFSRATVASAATTADIWGALGNTIDFTGTAIVTGMPAAAQAGATRELICAGACSFTAGANILIEGYASGNTLMCAANDIVNVMAITTTQFQLTFTKYSGKLGGSDTTSSAVDMTFTSASGRLQVMSMTAASKKVTLPAGTTLMKGCNVFVISNAGDYRFSVHSSGGVFLAYVSPGQVLAAHCSDTSTAAGVWRTSGNAIDRIYSGNTAEVLNAVATSYICVAMLTSTKAICAFKNGATTFLNVVILNYGSASGTPSAINAESSNYISIAAQTSAQATVVYKNATNITKGYVLDVSGNVITPGSVATIEVTAAGIGTNVSALSSTQLVCVYQNASSGTIKSKILDIAASAITPGGETMVDATTANGQYQQVNILSASKVLVVFANTSSITKLKLMSIAGSALTATGAVLTLSAPGTDPYLPVVSVAVSSTRALVAQSLDGTYGDIYLSLFDVSGTTPVLMRNATLFTGLGDAQQVYIGNLIKLSTGVFFLNWSSGSLKTDGMVIRITSDDKILLGEISDKLDSDSSNGQFCASCSTLDSTHIMQATRNSSGYLSAKTLEIAV